jgi:Ca-activated chloride channel family protein
MVASALIFAEPAWFWALPALVIAGAGLWKLSVRIAKRRMERFFSVSLVPEILDGVDWNQKMVRFALISFILMLLASALARPLTGPKADQDDRKGADLVIALDVSKSMWAQDVAPSRLEAVKKELSEWILGQKSDRIGLVLFAGKAFVQAPLTYDYTALDFVLRDAGPRSVSKKGTNIPEAIETAVHLMNNNKLESKVLLIISDGENLDGDAITAARTAHQTDGLTIYTVGVGTAAGAKVPTFDEKTEKGPPPNQGHYVRSEYGAEVVSRLDSQALRAIASVGGGAYFEFRPGESTFPNIRSKNISTLVEKTRKIKTRDYDEWFQIPLAFAILLMVLEPLICRIRRRGASLETGVAVVKPATYSRPVKRAAVRVAGAAALLLLSAGVARGDLTSPTAEADKLFAAGKTDEAVEFLHRQIAANPTDPYLNYNYGLGLYRAGRLAEANAIFQSVEGLAPDAGLRAQVLFQMGNISYRTGMDLLSKPGPQHNGVGAVRAFEQAMNSYQAHLQIQSNREASHNIGATSTELQDVLLAIGKERTRSNTEKTLREALQAYERATELNIKHQPLVDEAKVRLSKELAKNAAAADVEADKAEAGLTAIPEGVFKRLFEKREQIAAKLEEAVGLTPGDGKLAAALKKQQEKMSDLLTKAARDQSADALKTEKFFSNRSLKNLEEAGGKLDQALTLNPNNKEAQELNAKVKGKLVDAYVANGDLALGHLKKSLEADKKNQEAPDAAGKADSADKAKAAAQLEDAISAADAYGKALGLDPGNVKAKEGLAEANRLLPDLYSKAGKGDLDKAETQLGGNFPKPGENPDGENKEGENKEGEAPKGAPDGKPSAEALRDASATLERALQNLGAAAGLKPEDAGFKKDLSDAEKLMGAVRSELEKAQGLAAAKSPGGEPGKGKEGASGEGEGGTGEGKGPGKPGSGKSSLKSMSALRGKGGASGGSEGGESKRYWDKFVKDW